MRKVKDFKGFYTPNSIFPIRYSFFSKKKHIFAHMFNLKYKKT